MRLVFAACAALALASCGGSLPVTVEGTSFNPNLGVDLSKSTKMADGGYYRDLVTGTGATVSAGQTVGVYYNGYFPNGTLFNTYQPANGAPVQFTLDSAHVIQGWVDGVPGMKLGGRRQLILPPGVAYGANGSADGTIPPNAVLVFVIDAQTAQ